MKASVNMEDYVGAIAVMENYLDGALADLENGSVDNSFTIECCLNAIELIYALGNPTHLYAFGSPYRDDYERIKKGLGR